MRISTALWQQLDMDDTYALTPQWIDEVVPEGYAGFYAIGNANGQRFEVRYVGRSDSDVHQELRRQEEKNRARGHNPYKYFKYRLAKSAQAAFEIECQVFHESGGSDNLDNKTHPARLKKSGWQCPVDNCHELDQARG